MLVRIHKAHVDPRHRAEIEAIEDEVSRLYTPENGCHFVQFFGDPNTGWYGNFGLWESQEHIDALARRPELQPILQRLKPLLLEPPVTEVYPIYEPSPDRAEGQSASRRNR